jgi:hypothetical protein
MTRIEIIEQILYPVIDQVCPTIERNVSSCIFGEGSPMDSLRLVEFVLGVEKKVRETRGKTIHILSGKVMSREHSPFRSIGDFADFVLELIGEG